MKATGIVRRIDDLGRVVIPSVKELFYGKNDTRDSVLYGTRSGEGTAHRKVTRHIEEAARGRLQLDTFWGIESGLPTERDAPLSCRTEMLG